MKTLEDFIASKLLRVKAIKFQPQSPFIWANGWKSPVYCDTNKLNSNALIRSAIKLELARTILEQYPDCEAIVGVATNAIAMASLVADELGLPFVYVRPEPKDHGFENMIEGDLRIRQHVVIIDDQVNLGQMTMKVVETVRKNGCYVDGVATIFDFGLPEALDRFREAEVDYIPLCHFSTVLNKAVENELISAEDLETIRCWEGNPAKWQK